MRTANDYRFDKITNKSPGFMRKLHGLVEEGNLRDLWFALNTHLHGAHTPWDEVAKTSADGNRWIPLFHRVLDKLDPDRGHYVLPAAQLHMLDYVWYHDEDVRDKLVTLYVKSTAIQLLNYATQKLKEAQEVKNAEVVEDLIPMFHILLKRCQNFAKNKLKANYEVIYTDDDEANIVTKGPLLGYNPPAGPLEDTSPKFVKFKGCEVTKTLKDMVADDKIAGAVKAYSKKELKELYPYEFNLDIYKPYFKSNEVSIMLTPTIFENRLYIDGSPAKDMSDEVIFVRIADLEEQADVLAGIMTKSKKIDKRVRALRKAAKKLAAYVDGR